MPRQIERQLHARRKFRKALVDAELEVERAVLMPQHDRRPRPACRRRAASRSRTGRVRRAPGWRGGRSRHRRRPASARCRAWPSSRWPRAAGMSRPRQRRRPACARPRNGWRRARPAGCAGGAVPSASWAPSASRSNSSASRVASRQARTWDCSSRGRMPPCRSTSVKAFMAAPSSDTSRRISAWAPACRACLHQSGDGILGHVAIEQRRAERAVGIGADQSGQGDPVGAPHRNHRHQADQVGRAVRRGGSLHALSADTPVRPRAEAFTANSQSGR